MSRSVDNIRLSSEQQDFITKAMEGYNILVDACIGSGKTTAIQMLCNVLPSCKKILYLTYNRLLKLDAQGKISNSNVTVTNYHGFASMVLRRSGVSTGVNDLIQVFNQRHLPIEKYNVLILDEYQDLELELAEMLKYIRSQCPGLQIIAVGDMEQKIYDKTTLDVPTFIDMFLESYIRLSFTQCFRLSDGLASALGRIWNKPIVGVNKDCIVEAMSMEQVLIFLAKQEPKNILCLGPRRGGQTDALNYLESNYPSTFNKKTVYSSISDLDAGKSVAPKESSAIFTTYDSSKGLERPICVVFDFSESYWAARSRKPRQSYEILRNIFCVAASRGKKHIIFVDNGEPLLSESTLSSSFCALSYQNCHISHMFEFKYREDIEKCYTLLQISHISCIDDRQEIKIKNRDELIDLSPCIGNYQEAAFFKGYNIDQDIELWKEINKCSLPKSYLERSLDEKILYLTSLDTKQARYSTQVEVPFVSDTERQLLFQRLRSRFSEDDTVQVRCEIPFVDPGSSRPLFSAVGFADVVKNKIVYELKFVSELSHEHYLQCACYMIGLNLDVGILWNTRKNDAYEIRIPDKKEFMDAVANAITKGEIREYIPGKLTSVPALDMFSRKDQTSHIFAVVDVETNWQDEVISIGVVVASENKFQELDSKYYIITPECLSGGKYTDVLYSVEPALQKIKDRNTAISEIKTVLNKYSVQSIFAYNGSFDYRHLPELQGYHWYDIMRLAAYKQYNWAITDMDECASTGRLKSHFSAEDILKRLTCGNYDCEIHNALMDAKDELRIMGLLNQPLSVYYGVACVDKRENLRGRKSNSRNQWNKSECMIDIDYDISYGVQRQDVPKWEKTRTRKFVASDVSHEAYLDDDTMIDEILNEVNGWDKPIESGKDVLNSSEKSGGLKWLCLMLVIVILVICAIWGFWLGTN